MNDIVVKVTNPSTINVAVSGRKTIAVSLLSRMVKTTISQRGLQGATGPAGTGISSYAHTVFIPLGSDSVTLIKNRYSIINPAGNIGSLTLNMPTSPLDGDVVYVKFTKNVTSLAYSGGTVSTGPFLVTARTLLVFVYDSGTATWY